jgi:hypothetical protein
LEYGVAVLAIDAIDARQQMSVHGGKPLGGKSGLLQVQGPIQTRNDHAGLGQ